MTHQPDHTTTEEEDQPKKAPETTPTPTAVEEAFNPNVNPTEGLKVDVDTWQSQRRRRAPMHLHLSDNGTTNGITLSSAGDTQIHYTLPVPYDWVYGTPVRFTATFMAIIGGVMVWNSLIRLFVVNRKSATGNLFTSPPALENKTGLQTILTGVEARYIERLIGSVAIENSLATVSGSAGRDYDWLFHWTITRKGDSIADTAGIVSEWGVWIDYLSTYDYHHVLTE